MDTPRGYAILEFVGQFAETDLLESQQIVWNPYIKSMSAHPYTQRRFSFVGHGLSLLDTKSSA